LARKERHRNGWHDYQKEVRFDHPIEGKKKGDARAPLKEKKEKKLF